MREFYPEVKDVLNLPIRRNSLKKPKDSTSSFLLRQEGRARRGKEAGTRSDSIYHLEDWGKEPMALVFGRSAKGVVERVMLLLGLTF